MIGGIKGMSILRLTKLRNMHADVNLQMARTSEVTATVLYLRNKRARRMIVIYYEIKFEDLNIVG